MNIFAVIDRSEDVLLVASGLASSR